MWRRGVQRRRATRSKYILQDPCDDDDVYFRLQHGKEFHNLVYMSYVKHINPSNKE
jgi:hypothetical protein